MSRRKRKRVAISTRMVAQAYADFDRNKRLIESGETFRSHQDGYKRRHNDGGKIG